MWAHVACYHATRVIIANMFALLEKKKKNHTVLATAQKHGLLRPASFPTWRGSMVVNVTVQTPTCTVDIDIYITKVQPCTFLTIVLKISAIVYVKTHLRSTLLYWQPHLTLGLTNYGDWLLFVDNDTKTCHSNGTYIFIHVNNYF